MTASNFDEALKRVLVHEGGWSDHPKDPGGATMKGVTQRVYDGWRKRQGLPPRTVRQITESEIKAIYKTQYWDAIRGDDLPSGVDYCAFDAAANSGVAQSAKWLQRAVGVTADGQVGEATLEAVRKANPERVINSFCDRRLAMLKGLSTWSAFGKGWSSRVASVRKDALAMADDIDVPPPRPVEIEVAENKPGAVKATAQDRSVTDIAKSPEGIGGIITVVGAALNAATDPASPLAWALAVLVVAAVGFGGYYFVRRMRGQQAA